MSAWLPLGAFAAGLLVGRKKGSRTVLVPPRVTFIPLGREVEKPPKLEDVRKQVYETALKQYGQVDAATLDAVAREIWEYSMLMWYRDYYMQRIKEVSKAFSERRISRGTFTMLVNYYKRRLLEIELKSHELGGRM
ncbi:hypothetical protein [Infirmifilum sp. NZ]|uniref:hypothetical protein n=1 Tax=Infirmifilum sp. NZ TaxID=2926850 RepID=UPI0027A476A5|nr:hypothetical protein [Infirmifilum sp. NZ]UNQ73396.1 hypothetical protein MOV14_09830 [Infirmifilum sp. NZ]